MLFRARPLQQEILDYQGGWMGISAVPGSGKTFTLSALAARVVLSEKLEDDQEVLVVTLVNSAVHNFAARVGRFVQDAGGLRNVGYRVRTLHGIAHDIVRERPELVGLSDDFQIVDEREANQIRDQAAQAWLRSNPDVIESYLNPDLSDYQVTKARREQWPRLIGDIGRAFIRQAKDLEMSPDLLRTLLEEHVEALPLVDIGLSVYSDYQRALTYRGAVDFDDLIWMALRALRLDFGFLQRLQYRWPFILEDEAQDSNRVQEKILKLLVGPDGNWVRVGDPNQAIYETFTTANPQHLRDFVSDARVQAQTLPNSGRSTPSIIRLANYLVDWSRQDHPVEAAREALSLPHIEKTPEGDPQPNPEDNPAGVKIVSQGYSAEQELRNVVVSVGQWQKDHPDKTVAVLVPRNSRGFQLIDALKDLRSTRTTREAAGVLANVVAHLADPKDSRRLSTVYKVWRRADRQDEDLLKQLAATVRLLAKCPRTEDFLWPRGGRDWLEGLALEDDSAQLASLLQFRDLVRRWHGAAQLPIDQLLLTLAQDLFKEPSDLAIAHKMAGLLRRVSEIHPDWQLPELNSELIVIAKNERGFLGLSDDDIGFDPEEHRGKVAVATVHKAKGMEWDRVYLTAVNNYSFPAGLAHDQYISEKHFLRGRLNLEAEALAQLKILVGKFGQPYSEGEATRSARLSYVEERLRLLYVGITRAKEELTLTWNKGRFGNCTEAAAFTALRTFWEEESPDAAR